jgi:hypothetical protein
MDLKASSIHEMLRLGGHWLADAGLCAGLSAHPVAGVLWARVVDAHTGLAAQVAAQRERERDLARQAKRLARRELGQEGMAGALRRTLAGLQILAGDPGVAARYREIAGRLPAPVMACEREFAIERDAQAIRAVESAHTRLARLRWVAAVEALLGTLDLIDLTALRARMQRSLPARQPALAARPVGPRQIFERVQHVQHVSGQ